MSYVHVLKIWPEPFEMIRLGVKTAEVRNELGRTFRAGDILRLCEYDPEAAAPWTGREMEAQVTDLLRCSETPQPWNLQGGGGIVVMSLRLIEHAAARRCDRCGGKRWCPGCDR